MRQTVESSPAVSVDATAFVVYLWIKHYGGGIEVSNLFTLSARGHHTSMDTGYISLIVATTARAFGHNRSNAL